RTKISPAPMKPMPETIWEATRDGSRLTSSSSRTSVNPHLLTSMNSAAPTPTRVCVRSPAAFWRSWRSSPISEQSSSATSRAPTCSHPWPVKSSMARIVPRRGGSGTSRARRCGPGAGGSLAGAADPVVGVGQVERGGHQRHVAERLREVAHLAAGGRVPLLGEQPQVVAERQQPLEQLPGLLLPADGQQRVGHPEAAGEEGALVAGELVRGAL